jgi:hypothetical protein
MTVGRQPIPANYSGVNDKATLVPPVITLGYAVALGRLPGSKVIHLTGRRVGVSAEAEAWHGVAVRPYRIAIPVTDWAAAAEPLTVVSSSAADTSAGTGARVVLVEYLNADGYERVGLAIMAGLTPVSVLEARSIGVGNAATVTPTGGVATGLRITRAMVVQVGSGLASAGTISLSMTGGVAAVILVGSNLSMSSRFTCPRGMVAVVDGLGYGVSRQLLGDVRIYAQPLGKPDYLFSTFEAAGGALDVPLSQPIRVAALGGLGLTFQKDGGGANIDVSSVLQPVLFPDPSDPDPRPDLQPSPLG